MPPSVSLEALFRKYQLTHVDFLKIDIEGSEFDLVSTGRDMLARVDKIAMEVHPDHGRPSEILKSLQECGFQTMLLCANLLPVDELENRLGYLFAWRGPS